MYGMPKVLPKDAFRLILISVSALDSFRLIQDIEMAQYRAQL